jgi:hypothetical protein
MADTPMSTRDLPPIAERQLAAWQEIAQDWPTVSVCDVEDKTDDGEGVWVERCVSCFGGIYRVTDPHGHPYPYSDADRLALVVAHLRQAHLGLDPDR